MDRSKHNICQFNGERYSNWKLRIRSLFNEHNLIKIIDEERPEMPDEEWLKSDKSAKNIIIEYLSDSFLGFAKPNHSARQVFQELDKIYERKSLATQLSIRKKLLLFKYEADKPLLAHFTIFDDYMAELLAAGANLNEMDKISHLLLTLPASYNGVVTAIETLAEESLSMAFVKTRLLDNEIKLKGESKDTSEKVLQTISNKPQINYSNKYHTNKQQPRKFQQAKHINKRKIKKVNGKCHHCGRKGHFKTDCYYYKKMLTNNLDEDKTAQTANSRGFAFMIGHRSLCADSTKFLLDSGASDHIIKNLELFTSYTNLQPPLKISIAKDGAYIEATKKGCVKLFSNQNVPIMLEDVLYCKDVAHNLLSVKKMQLAGMSVQFNACGISVQKGGKVIIKGNNDSNVFIVDFKLPIINRQVHSVENKEYALWHQRLGHIGRSKFLEIKNSNMFEDTDRIKNIKVDDKICEACLKGKQSRLKYEKHKCKDHVNRPLFVIHTDVCGPITPLTVNDKRYYVIFVDQFTHYCVTYLIANKSEVFYMFKDFVTKSEAHFNLKVVNLYCDNGTEYLSSEMKHFCVEKGISYHLTVTHTPQLNGVSERMVRTLTEKARAMIHFAQLDKTFWGEAVLTATYLVNKSPSNALLKQKKTPYELWHGKKPQLKYLKVFGATVYVHNKTRKDKFEEKSSKYILVGYEPNGYKLWDVNTTKFSVARDVVVDEENFMITRPISKTDVTQSKGNEIPLSMGDRENIENCQEAIPENTDPTWHSNENIELRRSKRLKLLQPIHYGNESIDNCLMSAQRFLNEVPNSYEEIQTRDDRSCWEKAVLEELNSLRENKTWTIVSKPTNINIVDCKWVFTLKKDELGNPQRYKARLVAKGFTQQYLTDYDETYAPVARITSFRLFLAFANQYKLQVHHMDVKTAFLNGILKEDIYMKIPQGVKNATNKVCKLNKALYGLKQAARCWFEVFDKALKERGFVNSEVDRCIYISQNGGINKNIYILLYVDDLVIATACSITLQNFKKYLMSKFSMIDLNEIKHFIGIRIERQENVMMMSQSVYIKNILEKFNMNQCKPVDTPLVNKINYEALNSDEYYDAPCRNVIGCLMYIMICSRPDLSACVNILSRYANKSNKELWQSLKRVLRYLQGTINLKLVFEASEFKEILKGYVDSDWGGSNDTDRKSTTGFLFKLFDKCTVSWNTRKQLSVAASSTEAEYMALFEAVKEALWLKALAKSMHIEIESHIKLLEDNQGCISIANNPGSHKRSKHIDIKYHFSREQVENKTIKLEYIPTEHQLADVLTKPLPGPRFVTLRSNIGLK